MKPSEAKRALEADREQVARAARKIERLREKLKTAKRGRLALEEKLEAALRKFRFPVSPLAAAAQDALHWREWTDYLIESFPPEYRKKAEDLRTTSRLLERASLDGASRLLASENGRLPSKGGTRRGRPLKRQN